MAVRKKPGAIKGRNIMAEKSSASTQGITRFFTVVETMTAIGRPARLQDIAQQSDASPSTVMRILNAMIENGYAVQNPETQFYSLSYKFLQISNSIRENLTINSLIHPYLYKITSRTDISSALAIRVGSTLTYIDEVVTQSSMIRVHHHLGKQFPLYSTAAGKLFLSEMSAVELNKYFIEENMIPLTANTLTSRRKMEDALRDIKRNHYSYNNEEAALGMSCLAFPIYNSDGGLLAAISVSGTIYQINDNTVDDLVRDIKEVMDELNEKCRPVFTATNVADLF